MHLPIVYYPETETGVYRREMQVLKTCIASGYPVACVIGGGYADDMPALSTVIPPYTVPLARSISNIDFEELKVKS